MTDVALRTAALEARTVAVPARPDPLDHFAVDGFAWWRDGGGFVTAGVAARVAARDVADVLAAIPTVDEIGRRGTGPIAVGALHFTTADRDQLVIPRHVIGRERDGTTWHTTIGPATRLPEPRRDPIRRPASTLVVREDTDRDGWDRRVRAALDEIHAGRLQKVVLTRTLDVTATDPLEPVAIFRRLRDREPGRYLYATDAVVGASPELLVRRRGDTVVSEPLAGSWPADRPDAAAALAGSAKDRAEHRYVLDAVTAALARHCREITVGATSPVVLPDVVHLATRICARAGPETPSALELALALHPTPAVGGTPTDAALAFLAAHEPFRHHYAAPVGWVDGAGDGEFAVALRNVELLEPHRALVRAGAGIVAGSIAETEWREIDAKLAPALHALAS